MFERLRELAAPVGILLGTAAIAWTLLGHERDLPADGRLRHGERPRRAALPAVVGRDRGSAGTEADPLAACRSLPRDRRPYLAIAAQVRAGEWRTYGDISVAVRGDTMGARAVGRAAAMLEHFPHPHRVLQSGGRMPDGWKSSDSADPNPEECRRRLEAEGVEFDEHGRASRKHYVAWDVLVERADEQQAA